MIGLLRSLPPVPGTGRRARADAAPDLDERDPDFIRERLPGLWLLSSLYFRGDVRGLGNIPDDGQVLLVGNHSGGTTTPDTIVLMSAFSTYFGVERPLLAITRLAALSWPPVSWLRRFGIVGPTSDALSAALRTGATVLVYPGGDGEVHRPSWDAGQVDLGDDTSWVTEALRRDVPVVPVVAAGGQETALFLGRAAGMPVSIALPWVVHVGTLAGNVPLPAKLTVEVLHPIDLRATYGEDPDPRRVRDDIEARMQATLTTLQRGRRLPLIG